jgi:DNA polymerase-4
VIRAERVILHLDMDAFFAAIEVRDNPELAGKPVIVGHRGRRGVVSTCSYEARRFGVHSAMPSVTAERLCPQAVWVSGRMRRYSEIGRAIRAIMRDCSPLVEPLSIDEAFVDLTGIAPDLAGGAEIARDLKRRIRTEQRLTASAGVAPNKFLAKVGSDLEKPDGLVVLAAEDVPRRLWPLPVERLWGVGPKTGERLRAGGITTIGGLLRVPSSAVRSLVGASGAAHLLALARGEDDRPVRVGREAKSISEERTYETDLTDPDAIDREMLARAEGVARHLRRDRLEARTVHLKVRSGEFETWTRSHTLRDPTDLAEPLLDAARGMYRDRIRLRDRGVRLLGVGVSGLAPRGASPAPLFTDENEDRARRLARATDAVRDAIGERAVTRARLLKKKRGKGTEPEDRR